MVGYPTYEILSILHSEHFVYTYLETGFVVEFDGFNMNPVFASSKVVFCI